MKQEIKILAVLFVLILVFASCELKRNNPLDPQSNPDIVVPPQITGLVPSAYPSGVNLTWDKNDTDHTDWYYIYKSLAYNAAYERADSISNIAPGSSVSINIPDLQTGVWYYFKVSACKQYPAGNLEGPLSNFVAAHVGK